MTTRVLLAVLLLSAGLGAQRPGNGPRPREKGQARIPVVVELFTSEGCSSCPAADDLLARLDTFAVPPTEIIVLGEHVDYWDQLGWKDSFSSPLFSTRQQDYGIAFHSSSVYTPQAVVNGQKEVLGSDTQALLRAVSEVSRTPRAQIEMQVGDDSRDTLQLRVGKLPPGSHKTDVLLAVAESGIETYVSAGENQGKHLRHTAVVRLMSKLAELDPAHPGEYTAEARLNLRLEWKRSNVKLVLLLQDKENRRILGAASVPLTKPASPTSRSRPESFGRVDLSPTR